MNDNEQDLYEQQQNFVTNADPMQLILAMQQQHISMQEQMTNLMSQLLPTTTHPTVSLDSPIPRSKPDRPVITAADCTNNQWIIFLDAWKHYKQMSKLSDPVEIKNELRSACDATVNEMLFNFVGPDTLITANEDQLLSHIKSVAVKSIHPEV